MPDHLLPRKRLGILLVNLGTPDGTDYWSVRRYLREFLSDRRVVETPRLIWWPILNLIILSTRPGKRGKAYEQIWNKAENESPLRTITRAQSDALTAWIAGGGLLPTEDARQDGPAIAVDWAMRYGTPSIAATIDGLIRSGCERLLVVPLYPQYSAATTATVGDAVFAALLPQRFQPALRIAAPYYDAPAYIDALAASLHKAVAQLAFAPDMILVSYHGIPQDYADKGDPYPQQCEATFRLLMRALGRDEATMRMSYQSRFGPAAWLKPYTDATVTELAKSGVKNLVVITPGFSADCLETLEEIGLENRDYFLHNGGTHFAAIPCLNASSEGMAVIYDCIARELAGWL
ncbi:MAG: ferrochelatase [Methylovirgula sp.]